MPNVLYVLLPLYNSLWIKSNLNFPLYSWDIASVIDPYRPPPLLLDQRRQIFSEGWVCGSLGYSPELLQLVIYQSCLSEALRPNSTPPCPPWSGEHGNLQRPVKFHEEAFTSCLGKLHISVEEKDVRTPGVLTYLLLRVRTLCVGAGLVPFL